MFNKTLETVGDIVKDDFKFRTLFVTLVMVTPGEELSEETKASHYVVYYNMSLTLLFRETQHL